ncbi:porin family protein [Pasteurella testudinis]|uniref:porin family protein n=1 Tax=Pasteurella testudinis TaxID=761 RepID=UPI0040583E7E
MKKYLLPILLGTALATAATAQAAPAGQTFVGPSVGLNLATNKGTSSGGTEVSFKRFTSLNLIGDYGFDYGHDFVGLPYTSIKLFGDKLGESDTLNLSNSSRSKIKQRDHYALGYAQGYRITPNLLGFGKVDYNYSEIKFENLNNDKRNFKGFGYGAGVRYALDSDIELGVEYIRSNLKHGDDKLKLNTFDFSASYRF